MGSTTLEGDSLLPMPLSEIFSRTLLNYSADGKPTELVGNEQFKHK